MRETLKQLRAVTHGHPMPSELFYPSLVLPGIPWSPWPSVYLWPFSEIHQAIADIHIPSSYVIDSSSRNISNKITVNMCRYTVYTWLVVCTSATPHSLPPRAQGV